MHYYEKVYDSPLGEIQLVTEEDKLIHLSLPGQKEFIGDTEPEPPEGNEALDKATQWLDAYFSGKDPGFVPPIELIGTDYQLSVWKRLMEIPYGETVSYKDIAVKLTEGRGTRPAPHPVGQAVGRNPIAVIVPCHRVVSASGNLTGYGGGIDKKVWLLEREGIDTSKLKWPRAVRAEIIGAGEAPEAVAPENKVESAEAPQPVAPEAVAPEDKVESAEAPQPAQPAES